MNSVQHRRNVVQRPAVSGERRGHEECPGSGQGGEGTDHHPVGHDHIREERLEEQAQTPPSVTKTRRSPAAVEPEEVGNNSTPNVLRVTCAPRAMKIRPIQATTRSGPLTL